MTDGIFDDDDITHLRRCIELARQATRSGNEPFGSVLVGADGRVRFEDHNRTAGGDQTRHPEFEIARWAAAHLTPQERADATVFTSGEHCPMCAAAHAWVGLGRIVYASSTPQLIQWQRELGIAPGPVAPLRITEVAPSVPVSGPDPELSTEVRALHARTAQGR